MVRASVPSSNRPVSFIRMGNLNDPDYSMMHLIGLTLSRVGLMISQNAPKKRYYAQIYSQEQTEV